LPPAAVLAQTFPRLMAEETVGLEMLAYRRPVADGIVEVLNLDLPESVLTLSDERVERFGGLEVVRTHAMRNLRAVTFARLQVLEHEGGRITLLGDESMFTASTMLILDEVVARIEPPFNPEDGILVSVPFRHQLNVHAPRDSSVIPSLQLLTQFTKTGFDGARIVVEDEFGELLQRIVS
jgi:hypothetical protein